MEVGRIIFATSFIFCFIFHAAFAANVTKPGQRQLRVGFYESSCPQAELITTKIVYSALLRNPSLAAGLLRLFFHDCFVQGCDASILLDSTPSGEAVEKTSAFNGDSLKGLDLIDEIKAKLEATCPDVVSCADILTFATRDAAVFSGSSMRRVESGRRDRPSSRATDIPGNLPVPMMKVEDMIGIFTNKGMTAEDLVVLTGAHSIGKAHCGMFDYRLYNYKQNQARDPELNQPFAHYLSLMCPPTTFRTWFSVNDGQVAFDTLSPYRLDNSFFKRLLDRKTLLESDQGLAFHESTREIVKRMAFEPMEWSNKFAKAMVQLGRMDVLTGKDGEIRKNCRAVN